MPAGGRGHAVRDADKYMYINSSLPQVARYLHKGCTHGFTPFAFLTFETVLLAMRRSETSVGKAMQFPILLRFTMSLSRYNISFLQ